MAHNNHVIDGVNKDIRPFPWSDPQECQEYYLDLAKDWEDPYGPPVITKHEGIRVVRDDYLVGSKVRGGDCLISSLPEHVDTLVYVQPRTGLAGVSILDVAKRHDKKVKLFMPSSKQISMHQACCIERGAEVSFHRIAAMPNLNKIAKEWADERPNTFFIPLGLKEHFQDIWNFLDVIIFTLAGIMVPIWLACVSWEMALGNLWSRTIHLKLSRHCKHLSLALAQPLFRN